MMDLGCLLELLAFYVHSYLYMFIIFITTQKQSIIYLLLQ
jgi:hypothetical protein